MRVVAAMSGGVDSSVTAALLLEQGYEVIGVHMKLHDTPEPTLADGSTKTCCGLDDVNDCRRVAEKLGIPFYVMDLREAFKKAVQDDFVNNYVKGWTPNPCIQCNGVLKFQVLLQRARALGADYLATGHYAQITDENCLQMAIDQQKDQSYFLFPIRSKVLNKILFPLGGMTKSEVRAHAHRLGLVTASKPESQDICFLPNGNHGKFVEDNVEDKEGAGEIVDTSGNVLGHHEGYWKYTIGQRRGLGVAMGKPVYVVDIDADEKRVVVGEHDALLTTGLVAHNMNWFREPLENEPLLARIRHRGALHPCKIEHGEKDGYWTVRFDSQARAVAPGQAVVIYSGHGKDDERVVIGGGWIRRRL
jgi:tRNA-uridine 2-sulfurtransferase